MMSTDHQEDRISRRSFTRRVLGAGTAALAGLGASFDPVSASAPTQPLPDGTYLDIHTHITQEWGMKKELTAAAMVQWMDRNDISQAVILPLENPESWYNPVTTDYVLSETAPYRDRLIPFCTIDPRTVNLGGKEGFVEQLQKYIDAGARGFGEHKPGIPMADPRNIELYKACEEVGLPVLFHLDSMRCTDEVGLPGLETVLQEVPGIPFIGHAHGFWASISGDATKEDFQSYPSRSVTPGGALDRLMEDYPNLYGDLSAGSGANAIQRDLEFGREFLIRRQDQLLWGTDHLEPGENIEQFQLYEETLDLPEQVRRKVFRQNAREMLGLA